MIASTLCAWLLKTLKWVVLAALCTVTAVAQINPATGIRWPAGCQIYNVATGLCVSAVGGGITQLVGAVTAGPGTGIVGATIATVNLSPGVCGDGSHSCQISTNAAGQTILQTSIPISVGNVNAGTTGQTAYYPANGNTVSGESPAASFIRIVAPGGTLTGPLAGPSFNGINFAQNALGNTSSIFIGTNGTPTGFATL